MPIEPWSNAQVLALAPDPSSAKGARSVSGAAKWTAAGLDDDVLWGLCRGSGSNPYQACVDLTEPAYRCSCPSRKFPCKHALGLLLLWSDGGVTEQAAPDWVREWQEKRSARAANTAAKRAQAGPVDQAAAEKRAGQRADRVTAGLTELDRWLTDQVTQGLAGAQRAGSVPYATMAARLVDAQASTVAGTVRRVGEVVGVGADWADRLLGELSLLRLLVAGHSRIEELPAELAATVRSRVGLPVTTEEVLAGPALRDRWQVLGHVDLPDERLVARRTWLHGIESGRSALLLAFAAPGQALPADVVPGSVLDAELCWYPGAFPQRALLARRHGTAPAGPPVGAVSVRDALAGWSAALAAEPWCDQVVMLLADVVPTVDGHLIDRAGDAIALRPADNPPWWLLAAAGGRPVPVAGEYGPAGFRPLAAWPDGEYVPAPARTGADLRPAQLPPELVSAALVGTGRRPFTAVTIDLGGRALPVVSGADPATTLLDTAAVALTYQRAGVTADPGRSPVEAAPAETRPVVPAPAARRLASLLADGGGPGGAELGQRLLGGWLRLAAERGYLAPAQSLPALLESGRRSSALRAPLATVAGRRGGWLAAQNAEWSYLLTEAAPDPNPGDWATGTPGERLAYLVALRRADPAAGLDLLVGVFDDEAPEDRARFVGALANGLADRDEPLLERALDDRRKEVREAAAGLLCGLPGSALRGRMARRALGCVRLDGGQLVVTPPTECDAGMRRDGIPPKGPQGVGVGAWLLGEVVARTPLEAWCGAFDRTAEEILALPVADDWGPVLHRGLARAAVAQRDSGWLVPLADEMSQDLDRHDERLTAQLYEALSPSDLARYATAALRRSQGRALRVVELHPGPWPEPLADAVVESIGALVRGDHRTEWQAGELCRIAATALPPAYAAQLAELADTIEREHPETRRGGVVRRLAATLTFRHEMYEELR
ncbi:SWIM zinc finger protein [Micromonospora pisi]|uniref:SWIM zinc finger protein n=1 Tax=Micromonospora pisi TaxID=589240 RepID=A0A495JVX6_9ACTN|nr:DUF5691 domain-containing protein [Micromonospora pisi]RKR92414.1 SWIM zinc finger protein [Micromonospora pisi]